MWWWIDVKSISDIASIITPLVILVGYIVVGRQNVKAALLARETAEVTREAAAQASNAATIAVRSEQASYANGEKLIRVSHQVTNVENTIRTQARELKDTVAGVAETIATTVPPATAAAVATLQASVDTLTKPTNGGK